MSTEERDEIISPIRSVMSLLRWLGGGSFIAVMGLIILVVADHYDQVNLRHDSDWMKPRVERLWYKSHPDDLEPPQPLKSK